MTADVCVWLAEPRLELAPDCRCRQLDIKAVNLGITRLEVATTSPSFVATVVSLAQAALSAALENYKSDIGDYPSGTNTTNTSSGNNAFLRAKLAPKSMKVYFEFSKKMGTNSDISETNQSILDPFGNAYGYQYPGNTSRSGSNFFDLWSTAGTNNTSLWIKNW